MYKYGVLLSFVLFHFSVMALSPESLVAHLSDPVNVSGSEWKGLGIIHEAEKEKRLLAPSSLPLNEMDSKLCGLIRDGKITVVDSPEEYETLSFPFLYYEGEKNYRVFLWAKEKLYLPLDCLMNPAYRPYLNQVLKICFESGTDSLEREKKLKILEHRFYTFWAVDQEVVLPLRPRLYAQTCKSVIQNNPDLDYYDSVVHVLDPVLRSVYIKTEVLKSMQEKGSSVFSTNIHLPQSEEWVDAVLETPSLKKEILCIHQAYFHEGKSLSESVEALWRLGAGSLSLGKKFLEQLRLSLEPKNFSHEIFKINNLIRFLDEDSSVSSQKRKIALTLLNTVDPSLMNPVQTGLLEFARRMLQPGWLDHWFKKMSSGDIHEAIPSFDSVKVVIDTRFDLIQKHGFETETVDDSLSHALHQKAQDGKDPLYEFIRERFQELASEHPGKIFLLEKAEDHCTLPLHTEEIRIRVNELLQSETLAPGILNVMEGQLYSRYCGLLLELMGAEYLSELGFQILNTGLELTDDIGIYFTELDGVVKNPQTQRVALVEAKSMRTRLSKQYVLSNKVIYKLKTYAAKRKLIEKKLSTPFEDTLFIIDTGGNKVMDRFLKNQEKELERQFGFPVKFIALNMAKRVMSVTGYEGSFKASELNKTAPLSRNPIQKKKIEKEPAIQKITALNNNPSNVKTNPRLYRRLAKQELRMLIAQYQNESLQDKMA